MGDRETTDPRVPLTSVVSGQLLQLLRDEGLAEGDSIPPTGELAERFGVSRTVIRESLAELTGRGLIRRQQGREGVVALPGGDHLSSLFETRVSYDGVTFAQLQDVREVLEVGAARIAARHAQLPDIARLSDLLHAMRTATDDQEMLAVDLEFHRAVATTANPLFGLILDGLSPMLMQSRLAVWQSYLAHGGDLEGAIARHAALRDRIAAQDEEGAAAAMRDDLQDTRDGLTGLG
ncbi:FadR/GntR family transcriptional regulator [Jiangella muralis]|uniref:FadR/GntR family transcriptional regulator n=1 Tax=Jiangella muralis TaxID=702383 RepID=UPI0009FA09E9|nr:FCD domain-containing protein [Jiangella muralis]